jgi:3-hydroxyacyl-CoA dehydrogenase/3-hydroxy-2-methylbutyryl-CoA dehydrogenase
MLVAAGGQVGIVDLPSSGGLRLAEELGSAAIFVPADVRDPAAVRAGVDCVADTFGGIHLCVNAAGVADPDRVLARDGETMFSLEVYRKVLDINLVGLFDVLRNASRVMARNAPGEDGERGVVVNVASIAGYDGQAGQAAYAASKGGVIAMTLPLARDLASWGIRVVTVCPGIFDTGMLAGAPPKMRERLADTSVFPKRLGAPSEFGRLVQAIAENAMLNGEVVRLDAAVRLAHG